MTNYDATMIAEGVIECNSKEKIIKAWQHLIDTELAWKLRGWFGRAVSRLIEAGICHK